MRGTIINIETIKGDQFDGYLSLPESGTGPGLILLQEIFGVNDSMRETADLFADEGYVVVVPDLFWRIAPHIELGYSSSEFNEAIRLYKQFNFDTALADIGQTISYLNNDSRCEGGIGCVGFCLGGTLSFLTAAHHSIDVAISFYGAGIGDYLEKAASISCPIQLHFGELDEHIPETHVKNIRTALEGQPNVDIYSYSNSGHAFFNHYRKDSYNRSAAMMAHSRTISALRKALGPEIDLEKLWEDHVKYEFVTRNVGDTLKTMVSDPYVNHIPTMTGGTGAKELKKFYQNHFIPQMPKDTHLVPISRTVGGDRIVDEMIFCFTHDIEMDWMLPGIPPTGKNVEIPLVAIVNFRGDKLYHEHIYWDQASLLVQIGILDPKNLPITGIDSAKKVQNKDLPSNTLMKCWKDNSKE